MKNKAEVGTSILSRTSIGNGRVVYLDILRLVATIGVVFLHVAGLDYQLPIYQFDWYVAVIGDSSVRWCVPIFVMISGVLFLAPSKNITIHNIFISIYADFSTHFSFGR